MGAVDAIAQGAATALVPPRPPCRLNVPDAVRRVLVAVAAVAGVRWQAVAQHVAGREAHRHQRLRRVDRLGKKIVVQRDGTHVFEHVPGGDAVAGYACRHRGVAVEARSHCRDFFVERTPARTG